MSEWKKSEFGTCFTTVYRYPTYFNIKYTETGIKEIRGELLSLNGKIGDECRYISRETADNFPKVRLRKGDIVMSVRGTMGKLGIVGEKDVDAVITANLLRLSPDKTVADSNWLLQLLMSEYFKRNLEKASSQTTISTIQIPQLLEIPIERPSLPIQESIATILSTIDRAIEHTEALIEKYQQIKTGLMHDLFTRGIGEDGKLRPPRSEAPELYKETEIGWIPREWGVKKLEDVVESINDGPFGSNLKTEHYVDSPGIRVVRLQNVVEYRYNDNDRAFISEKHALFLNRNKVISLDVLIAGLGEERYPVGRACCYPQDLPPAINKADCFRARCDKNVMINEFLMLSLNSTIVRKQIRRFEQGVTRPRINTGNLKKIKMATPLVTEQEKINHRYQRIQLLIEHLEDCTRNLQYQKTGLMHDLLTGKVEVTVTEAEPSNV